MPSPPTARSRGPAAVAWSRAAAGTPGSAVQVRPRSSLLSNPRPSVATKSLGMGAAVDATPGGCFCQFTKAFSRHRAWYAAPRAPRVAPDHLRPDRSLRDREPGTPVPDAVPGAEARDDGPAHVPDPLRDVPRL